MCCLHPFSQLGHNLLSRSLQYFSLHCCMQIKLTDLIDSTWTIAIERADAAGRELARALARGVHGTRPVTLIGHSIGARVVYACLKVWYRTSYRTMYCTRVCNVCVCGVTGVGKDAGGGCTCTSR